MYRPSSTLARKSIWQLLLRWRWWLSGTIALTFALGRVIEAFFLQELSNRTELLFDVLFWGALGGLSVWVSFTWLSKQERRHQAELEALLQQQQELNQKLQQKNAQLSLLSDVNHSLAASKSLDEILDIALRYPQRLVPCKAAALWLHDASGAVLARTSGVDVEQLHELRARFMAGFDDHQPSQIVTTHSDPDAMAGLCLRIAILDGVAENGIIENGVMIGWIELFTGGKLTLEADERALLQTITGEIGEAINGARRRSREERAIYELERAIGEERARIARDIHDGLAQTLAFRRMRVDLWLDWLEQDPQRLRQELVDLKPLLREQIAELRRAIFALRPIQFDEFGFVGGLHRYINEFSSQQGWTAQVDLSELSTKLSPQLEAICFRIVQEALTNAAKHAQATTIHIQSARIDNGLQLTIRDNGQGFSPGSIASRSTANEGDQLGLRQMSERLNALQGQLTILSQPGAGTELRVWIPIQEKIDEPSTLAAG